MIDHLGITCADRDKSGAKLQDFYDTVLGVLGQMDIGHANREIHLACEAADENAVRAFHEAP